MKIGILVLLALVGAAPLLAQRPAAGSWHEQVRRLRRAHAPAAATVKAAHRLTRSTSATPVAASAFTTVAEQEPNNTVATANSAALGDQGSGVVDPSGDRKSVV